jgi:hypothetical protein
MTAAVPELAIVPIELWDAVQARLADVARIPATFHRKPKHLFSGMLRCVQLRHGRRRQRQKRPHALALLPPS